MSDTGTSEVPHSTVAEVSLLSSLMMNEDTHDKVFNRIRPGQFYEQRNATTYKAMKLIYDAGGGIDATTVMDRLKQIEKLEAVGGPPYIAQLIEASPGSLASAETHCQTIENTAKLRNLLSATETIRAEISSADPEDAETVLERAESQVFSVSEDIDNNEVESAGDILWDTMELIEERQEQEGSLTGIPSGFRSLDHKTGGFGDGNFIVVAARPSMGKTAFAFNIAQNASIQHDYHSLIFSMEMSREECMQRMLASEARVDLTKIRNGELEDDDMERISKAAGLINKAPMWVDETPSMSPSQILAKSRRAMKERRIDIIVVDYLQLMNIQNYRGSTREEVTEFSRALKAMAKELKVPVIALSQLSRAPENREDKRPVLSDLRETGAIEQDADLAMFLYRSDYYSDEEPTTSTTEVLVRKQRNGPTGAIRLDFTGKFVLFSNRE